MKKYLVLIGLIFSACEHSESTTPFNTATNQCATRSAKSLQGQIQYFDGMSLKVRDCKVYSNSNFDFNTEDALRKVTAQIDFERRQEFHYVDLEFTGYINWKGKLIIKSVESAQNTTEIIF